MLPQLYAIMPPVIKTWKTAGTNTIQDAWRTVLIALFPRSTAFSKAPIKLFNSECENSKQLLAILFEQFPVSRLEWNLWSNEKSFSIRFRPMTRVVRCFTVANVYDLYWSAIGSSKCKLPQRRNGSIKGATVSSCPVFCITELLNRKPCSNQNVS